MTPSVEQSPVVLAFDTSGPYCAAALLCKSIVRSGLGDPGPVLTRVDEMAKGQAEHLMPMLDEMLTAENLTWQDIDVIGVGIGPGNFTGIRISVSAARGLALGLGIPAIGVSHFEAIGLHQSTLFPFWAVVPAPRGRVYVQRMDVDRGDPQIVMEDALDALPETKAYATDQTPAETIAAIARVAFMKRHLKERPAPLYIKPPDAAPARDAPPVVVP